MNEVVNKFLLAGDKFMPEMHLKQSSFPYSACGSFTQNKERVQKFIIVCIGVSTSPLLKNTTHLFLAKLPLKYANFPSRLPPLPPF